MGLSLLRHQPIRNEVLYGLPTNELENIRPSLKFCHLVAGQILLEQGQPAEHVFFLEEGVASLVAQSPGDGASVQVAMIGREGIVGGHVLLEAQAAPLTSCLVHIPGPAYRMSVNDLEACIRTSAEFHRRCLSAFATHVAQIIETSASNARNTIAERCARWLLMAHDRTGGAAMSTTHEALSAMLGVRRAGVTTVLTALQDDGLISLQRGRITVLDREGLQQAIKGPSTAPKTAALTRPVASGD